MFGTVTSIDPNNIKDRQTNPIISDEVFIISHILKEKTKSFF